MCRSAHSMRRTPSGASARSRTSNRLVVAMSPLFPSSSGEQPLVLALLPFERLELDAREPAVDSAAECRVAPQPRREGQVRELDAEAPQQGPERAELVRLAEPVEPVAAPGPAWHGQAGPVDVPGPARRPCCAGRRL